MRSDPALSSASDDRGAGAGRDKHARNGYSRRTPLHVAHVVATLSLGGAERFCVDLAAALQERGVRSSVCAMYRGGELAAPAEDAGVSVHVIRRRVKHDPVAFARLVRWLRRERPDVVHVHDVAGIIRGAPAARLAGVPAIVSVRHDVRSVGRIRDLLLDSAERLVDAPVASGEAVRRHVDRHRPGTRRAVIPCGIDLRRFPYRDPPQRRPFRLLSIGRLEEQKGHAFLIEALPRVLQQWQDTRLTIVGDGPSLSDLRARTAALGLAANVEVLPPDPDTRALLDRADLFCFPSLWEAQGLAMIEAQAVGVPVLASAVDGIVEHVRDGANGRLAPPGDARVLSDAMIGLLGAHEERVRVARAARTSAEALDVGVIAQRWLEVYAQAGVGPATLERDEAGR